MSLSIFTQRVEQNNAKRTGACFEPSRYAVRRRVFASLEKPTNFVATCGVTQFVGIDHCWIYVKQ